MRTIKGTLAAELAFGFYEPVSRLILRVARDHNTSTQKVLLALVEMEDVWQADIFPSGNELNAVLAHLYHGVRVAYC